MNDEMLPEWASKKSDGDYMRVGTQLCTRDGKKVGNAVVISIGNMGNGKGGIRVATILTDAGNKLRLIKSELEQLFYVPNYIMKKYNGGFHD